MDTVKKLDTLTASWYKKAPHLPTNGQKWLAENIWWIVLIGVILGTLGAVQYIAAAFFVGAVLGGVLGAVALTGIALVTGIITLGLSLVSLIISAIAIKPLKDRQPKGWTYMFAALLISILSTVISLLLSWNIASFIVGLIFIAVGAYFLYEIRNYFIRDIKEPTSTTPIKPTEA